MTSPLVLDSSALLAISFQEIGAAFVLDCIRDAGTENYIHGVNACEVAYNLLRRGFPPSIAWELSPPAGVHQIDDIKGALGGRVAALKTAHPFLALGDCFAISLAEQLDGSVLTGDKRFSEADTTAELIFIR